MSGYDLESALHERLARLEAENLRRHLRPVSPAPGPGLRMGGRDLLNFSSNDYLGLAIHPRLQAAAIDAIQRYGTGSGASRLICGSLEPHHQLEEALADFKQTEAALLFSSGYAAALGTITALVGKDDFIVIDRRVHACAVDAARLSGAKLRVFAHNDPGDLERILRWCDVERSRGTGRSGASARRVLIVIESLYSMDGDFAPLAEIVRLKDRHGAWLMVDEAHATGLYGPRRSGLLEAAGLAGAVEIQLGTLGKAIGAAGGFIAGSRALIDYLVSSARAFIFSTAPAPAVSAAARAGLALIRSDEGADRVAQLWRNVALWPQPPARREGPPSPIQLIQVGSEGAALALAEQLAAAGFFIPAVRYPSVARNQARLRLTFSAAHTPPQVEKLAATLGSLRKESIGGTNSASP